MALLTMAVLNVSPAEAQSLGDAARRNRQDKKAPSKVYTNDNLPVNGTISIIGAEPPAAPAPETAKAAAAKESSTETAGEASNNTAPEATPETSNALDKKAATSVRAQRDEELRSNAGKMKAEIAQLEREVDLLNREFRLRAATYYADAGNSLRDPKQWADQQRQHETQMKEKQAALESSKQKFAELQEQGRRAGMTLE